jgi:hypothetical protein
MVLETYARGPDGKQQCLELLAANGIAFPDTPTLALHRGRIDLLDAHLARDPRLLRRTFAQIEIGSDGQVTVRHDKPPQEARCPLMSGAEVRGRTDAVTDAGGLGPVRGREAPCRARGLSIADDPSIRWC